MTKSTFSLGIEIKTVNQDGKTAPSCNIIFGNDFYEKLEEIERYQVHDGLKLNFSSLSKRFSMKPEKDPFKLIDEFEIVGQVTFGDGSLELDIDLEKSAEFKSKKDRIKAGYCLLIAYTFSRFEEVSRQVILKKQKESEEG